MVPPSQCNWSNQPVSVFDCQSNQTISVSVADLSDVDFGDELAARPAIAFVDPRFGISWVGWLCDAYIVRNTTIFGITDYGCIVYWLPSLNSGCKTRSALRDSMPTTQQIRQRHSHLLYTDLRGVFADAQFFRDRPGSVATGILSRSRRFDEHGLFQLTINNESACRTGVVWIDPLSGNVIRAEEQGVPTFPKSGV